MPHGPERIDYQETPDLTEVHASIQREHKDPTADVTPVPLWLTVLCGAAVCWAGAYIGMFHGGFSGNVYNEFESNPRILFGQPESASKKIGPAGPEDPIAIGKGVYANTCLSCHMPTGGGQPGSIPPLAKSEWVNGGEKRMVAIVLKGLTGPVTVAGNTFNNQMPPHEGALSAKKIAAVVTYVRQSFGNTAGPVSTEQVEAAKKEFTGRTAQWTAAELQNIPADATLEGGPPAGAAPAVPAGSIPPTPAPAETAKAAAPALGAADVAKLMEEGKKTYMTLCVACHQPTGTGLPPVFPPLLQSEYVNGSPERLAAMILKGVMGPITIHGKLYNNIMPGQEAMLNDQTIAGVLTFVRSNFQNKSGPVTPDVVAAARKKYADRKTPWTEPDLKAMENAGAAPGAAAPSPAPSPATPAAPGAASPAPGAPAPAPGSSIPSPAPAAPSPGAPAAPASSTPAPAAPAPAPVPVPGAPARPPAAPGSAQ